MQASHASEPEVAMAVAGDRRQALERCRTLLAREGFTVSLVVQAPARRRDRPPELIASSGPRAIRVFVLGEDEVNAPETRSRIRSALKEGETRVYVPWPLRWRVLSNLERWRLRGAAVAGW